MTSVFDTFIRDNPHYEITIKEGATIPHGNTTTVYHLKNRETGLYVFSSHIDGGNDKEVLEGLLELEKAYAKRRNTTLRDFKEIENS